MGPPTTLQLGSYSTSEQPTRYKWIDGKVIYQKTIDFGALPDNTSKIVPSGITGIDRVVLMSGYVYGGGNTLPLSYVNAAGGNITLANTATGIYILTDSNRSSYSAYVTIYYTKS